MQEWVDRHTVDNRSVFLQMHGHSNHHCIARNAFLQYCAGSSVIKDKINNIYTKFKLTGQMRFSRSPIKYLVVWLCNLFSILFQQIEVNWIIQAINFFELLITDGNYGNTSSSATHQAISCSWVTLATVSITVAKYTAESRKAGHIWHFYIPISTFLRK